MKTFLVRLGIILGSLIAIMLVTLGTLVNEKFVWLFVGNVGIVLVATWLWTSYDNSLVKARAKEAGANDGVRCWHVEGLDLKNDLCEILSFDDRLQIKSVKRDRTFNLPLDRLRAIETKTEQEIKEVQKSVVGRAIVGNLLVPGIGAIVGGLSGIGTKKRAGQVNHFLIINYVDSQDELKGITFLNNVNIFRLDSFAKRVRSLLPQEEPGRIVDL